MRIIKPQQLVVLKSACQLGHQSWLGVSVVAGCYLSRPEQFVPEAKIWQAWQDAPHLMPVLDCAEPKPYAEYLLAGHIFRTPAVAEATASVRVGSLEKHWRITGDRQDASQAAQHFSLMPLDHDYAASGEDKQANPAAKTPGNIALIGEHHGGTLVAASPVPHHFPQRARWMQAVQPEIGSSTWLEEVFPGLPEQLDERYFQMAPPEQWLDTAEWPAEIPVVLCGFQQQQEVRCTLPAISAVLLAQYRDQVPQPVALARKTLWLLPDSDLALMIFTGRLPLPEMLDESITLLMAGLESVAQPRGIDHFNRVLARRCAADCPVFEFLRDPDLMPAGMALEVVRSAEDHPDSASGSGVPADPALAEAFYRQLEALAQTAAEQTEKPEPAPLDWRQLACQPCAVELVAQENELNWKTFQDFELRDLRDKTFRNCRFIGGVFSAALDRCRFEYCHFEATCWRQATLDTVTFEHTTLEACEFHQVEWRQVTSSHLTLERCHVCGSRFNACRWESCLMNGGDYSDSRWHDNVLKNCTVDESHLGKNQMTQCTFDACVFHQSDMQGMQMANSRLTRCSTLDGEWQESVFQQCYLESFTVGSGDFTGVRFSHCWLKSLGMKGISLKAARLENCAVLESNFDQSVITDGYFNACDMASSRWKDAILAGSIWQATSLQQGQFYHADLRDACFRHCNMAGAALARIRTNAQTCFTDCLLEQAIWLPRDSSPPSENAAQEQPQDE